MRRIPYGGASNTLLGLDSIESVLGPMSSSLSGCVDFMKGVLSTTPSDFDPKCIEMPWREEWVKPHLERAKLIARRMYQLKQLGGRQTKLSFAFFEFDGVVMPTPPLRRAVRMMKVALEKAGHEGKFSITSCKNAY
jgi:amidase